MNYRAAFMEAGGEPAGEDAFLLVQSELRVNEEPNCQGMSGDAVLANYLTRVYVVVDGNTLRMHMGEGPDAPSFTMERLEP